MKNVVKISTALVLVIIALVSLASCGEKNVDALWESALYTADTSFGEGATLIEVEVVAGEKSVTFTLNTDKETLGDALLEHELIEGEEGPYGLYVKKVNGILADFDVDQSYWALNKDGEAMMTGVDGTQIADGEHYELVYTK